MVCRLDSWLRVKFWRKDRATVDRLSGPVVRVPDCLPRGPGFDSRRCHIFYVAIGLERGPLSLMRINEELLEINLAAPV
jgi:hypothetical protein